MGKYYAVKVGLNPGVYTSWDECLQQVKGYPGAVYKSFSTQKEAIIFIDTSKDDFTPDHIINTDGGCVGNGTLNSKGGVGVTICGPKINHEISLPLAKTFYDKKIVPTNQVAELFAVATALEYIIDEKIKGCKFVLRTDSQYSIQCLTSWCQGWIANGWRTRNGPVQNKEIIQHILGLIDTVRIDNKLKFEHVYGHTGDHGNERVDELASQGIQMY